MNPKELMDDYAVKLGYSDWDDLHGQCADDINEHYEQLISQVMHPRRIAVFSPIRDHVKQLNLAPENLFKVISRVSDIRGELFSGYITLQGWYRNDQVREAYDELRFRQPELI